MITSSARICSESISNRTAIEFFSWYAKNNSYRASKARTVHQSSTPHEINTQKHARQLTEAQDQCLALSGFTGLISRWFDWLIDKINLRITCIFSAPNKTMTLTLLTSLFHHSTTAHIHFTLHGHRSTTLQQTDNSIIKTTDALTSIKSS